MRYPIWKKDDEIQNRPKKTILDPNAVTLPDSVPLTWNFNRSSHGREVHGVVTDIRVEDGEITGEVEFYEPNYMQELLDEGDARLGGYYSGISEREEDDIIVCGGILREVSGFPQPLKPSI